MKDLGGQARVTAFRRKSLAEGAQDVTNRNDGERGITLPVNLAHAGMYAHDSMRKVTRPE
jgi:hypothetical protein